MKSTHFLLMLILLAGIACRKDKDDAPRNYDEITREHILAKETSMNGDAIQATNAGGIIWKAGDVYIFRNRLRVLGKLQVVAIDPAINYQLTIRATIYNNNGSVAKQTDAMVVRGTFSGDLSILAETMSALNSDFHWTRQSPTDTYLTPQNQAVFVKYNL